MAKLTNRYYTKMSILVKSRLSFNFLINKYILIYRKTFVIGLLGRSNEWYMHDLSSYRKRDQLLQATLKYRYKFAFYAKIQVLFFTYYIGEN